MPRAGSPPALLRTDSYALESPRSANPPKTPRSTPPLPSGPECYCKKAPSHAIAGNIFQTRHKAQPSGADSPHSEVIGPTAHEASATQSILPASFQTPHSDVPQLPRHTLLCERTLSPPIGAAVPASYSPIL